jgi:hypothetical protein
LSEEKAENPKVKKPSLVPTMLFTIVGVCTIATPVAAIGVVSFCGAFGCLLHRASVGWTKYGIDHPSTRSPLQEDAGYSDDDFTPGMDDISNPATYGMNLGSDQSIHHDED